MKTMDLLVGFGSVKDSYVIGAEEFRQGKHKAQLKRLSTRKMWLIAAVIALTLLLVGCAVAYANGWFQQIFSARSETPLSSEQIQYIQNNEQIVGQSQTINDWTVDLKSTICDGRTGYLVFQITAPDGMDLEQYLNPPTVDDKRLSPGNYSVSRDRMYPLSKASIGNLNEEKNYMFADGGNWISDNDGKANSVLYCMSIRCEKLYPDKPMLLEEPFGKENTFHIRFMGITLEYTNLELQKEIEEKYAGQAYLVDGEEAAGLFCSDILTDEEWNFDVTFDSDNQFIELITHPVSVQAKVWRYADEEQWETKDSLEEVQISSFRVTPFGANITFVPKSDTIGISLQLRQDTDDEIYAVMKDGSRIKLDLTGADATILQAQTPIVLSQLDYILLEDRTKLFAPNI
ncbi:MAG: DUF4179 domain-containing protein [Firmicutes bacterium]|nr:DUF4179 domain-containing protein [Bacillota bacterium]